MVALSVVAYGCFIGSFVERCGDAVLFYLVTTYDDDGKQTGYFNFLFSVLFRLHFHFYSRHQQRQR